ncbi:MAG: hypothetical protein NTAFB01_26630 [Nitrospira sp.]
MDNPPECAYYEAIMLFDAATPIRLPPTCETALLERFLKAEAMALWTVRSARLQDVPPNVYAFLRKHEEDEEQHLAQFETMIGRQPRERERLPSVPRQWPALAVQLYGYESLGLEFATLLVTLRPDLVSIRKDELVHVEFFEHEIRRLLKDGASAAEQTRVSALAWWRKLPRTVDRYLEAAVLDPYRQALTERILSAIERRFRETGLLERKEATMMTLVRRDEEEGR